MLDLKKILVLLSLCITSLAHHSNGETINLETQKWLFKIDNNLSVDEVFSSSKDSWETILLGDYWQNLGFPNTKSTKHPMIGWYSCRLKIPKEMKKEKLFLRIGAIDDLDKAYVNGHLIGETTEDTPSFWRALRFYPIPQDILNYGDDNEIVIRVEDLRGNGGITTGPFEIIAEKDIPKVETKINPLNFRTGTLEFSVEYKSEEDAKNSKLVKLPLPAGKEWAFSMRWDDNTQKNFRMHDLMSKYGFKGAFYLYSNFRFNPKGMNYGEKEAQRLSTNGCVVAAHSMTHPNMPRLTKNEMFYEASAIKVERERDINYPITAFVFPGGGYRSNIITKAWSDIGDALARTGYHHNLYPQFVNAEQGISDKAVSTVQSVTPGDRKADPKVFDKQLNRILSNKRCKEKNPNITWGVHVWLDEEGWKNAESIMKKYQGREEWWYCSPNEYAAYRYLFFNSTLETVAQNGSVVRYRLTYPWSADLGDNVPLSIKIENATAKSCSVSNDSIKLEKADGGGQCIKITQPIEHTIPRLIDTSDNINNLSFDKAEASVKFPGIKSWLSYDRQTESLKLVVKNDGDESLKNIFLKVRTPLRYQKMENWIQLEDLIPGQEITRNVPLEIRDKSEEYDSGRAYFVAQMDFMYKEAPARLYATARERPGKKMAVQQLRDSATILFPLQDDKFNDSSLIKSSKTDYVPVMLSKDNLQGWFKNNVDPEKWSGTVINLRPSSREWRKVWDKKLNSSPSQAAIMINFSLDQDSMIFIKSTVNISDAYLNGKKCSSPRIMKAVKGHNRVIIVTDVRARLTQLDMKIETRNATIEYQ